MKSDIFSALIKNQRLEILVEKAREYVFSKNFRRKKAIS
jgi:hypothetical protein